MNNIIILGSGRSGTSMLAGMFANLDCFFGDNPNYLGKNKSNPKGFYEDYEINTINEDILKQNLTSIPEILRKVFFPSFTFYRARWLARLPLNKKIISNDSIENKIVKMIQKSPFCYKDPRFSYTLPTWQKILRRKKIDVKYIVVYREPNKTASSIVRECEENKALHTLKMKHMIALKVWELMYSHILKNYNKDVNKDNWMFIHYNQLFNESNLDEIEKHTNSKFNRYFPNKQLSRTFTQNFSKVMLPDKVKTIYNQLNTLSKYI